MRTSGSKYTKTIFFKITNTDESFIRPGKCIKKANKVYFDFMLILHLLLQKWNYIRPWTLTHTITLVPLHGLVSWAWTLLCPPPLSSTVNSLSSDSSYRGSNIIYCCPNLLVWCVGGRSQILSLTVINADISDNSTGGVYLRWMAEVSVLLCCGHLSATDFFNRNICLCFKCEHNNRTHNMCFRKLHITLNISCLMT